MHEFQECLVQIWKLNSSAALGSRNPSFPMGPLETLDTIMTDDGMELVSWVDVLKFLRKLW